MKERNILFSIFIFLSLFLLNPTSLLAMDNFGPEQQKELHELNKKLFKAVRKVDIKQINEILGEQSNISESYRSVLFEMRSKGKQKTLLQKAYPKYIQPECKHFCGFGLNCYSIIKTPRVAGQDLPSF